MDDGRWFQCSILVCKQRQTLGLSVIYNSTAILFMPLWQFNSWGLPVKSHTCLTNRGNLLQPNLNISAGVWQPHKDSKQSSEIRHVSTDNQKYLQINHTLRSIIMTSPVRFREIAVTQDSHHVVTVFLLRKQTTVAWPSCPIWPA